MNKIFLKKVLITLISGVCLLLVLVPYTSVFYVGNNGVEGESWKSSYVLDDVFLTFLYLPFIILWVAYLFLKSKLFKGILKFILIGLSILYFVIAFLNLTMPVQDAIPHLGVYVSIIILPLVFIYLRNDQSLNEGI